MGAALWVAGWILGVALAVGVVGFVVSLFIR